MKNYKYARKFFDEISLNGNLLEFYSDYRTIGFLEIFQEVGESNNKVSQKNCFTGLNIDQFLDEDGDIIIDRLEEITVQEAKDVIEAIEIVASRIEDMVDSEAYKFMDEFNKLPK